MKTEYVSPLVKPRADQTQLIHPHKTFKGSRHFVYQRHQGQTKGQIDLTQDDLETLELFSAFVFTSVKSIKSRDSLILTPRFYNYKSKGKVGKIILMLKSLEKVDFA